MKTQKCSILDMTVKLDGCKRAVIIAVFIFGGFTAGAQDFKTFDNQESYIVDGTSIILTQKIGETSVKLAPLSPAIQNAGSLAAAGGVDFNRTFAFPNGLSIYRLQTNTGPLTAAASTAAIVSLNSDTNIQYAYPVYVNPNTGNRLFLSDQIIVRLKTSSALHDTNLSRPFKLRLVSQLSASRNTYIFKLTDPKNFNPFKVCSAVLTLTNVVWAEPNFAMEANAFAVPNDSLFSSQWHLHNTGQSGGTTGADIDAESAWDGSQGYGSVGIWIAIIDEGVQTDHPDLEDNIVQGYDFYSDDSDPSPDPTTEPYDNHGTAVAGLAAASVNNSAGIAGVAGKCQILPVRLFHDSDGSGILHIQSTASIVRAIEYAADNADIINCSWGGLTADNAISDAFSYASTSGRGGYGCPVFCSSGNGASGWLTWTLPGFTGGSWTFKWEYSKDGSGSDGEDTAWLDSVVFPGGSVQKFEGTTLPSGWTTTSGSAASWASVQEGVSGNHALIAWNGEGSRAIKAGTIGNNQKSGVQVTQTVGTGDLTFRMWTSSQAALDGWRFFVNNVQYRSWSGVPTLATAVSYPASLSSTLAVGASSDFDYRADFSQYGSPLDFVAPGGGGSGGIATTDRTGSSGYGSGDYITTFSGTSASSPIAAGIAALVLSKDGKLSASTVATKLESTCDKVGPVTYSGTPYTRNDYYGYGRLNANAAVSAVTADTTSPTFASATVLNHREVDVEFSEPMGEGALDPNSYTITAGQGTLSSSHPDRVVRIGYVVVGFGLHYGTYRLIWDSGEIATSGTVTVAVNSSTKDVAGNTVTGTLSRSSTGTKRQIAVDCGSPDEFTYNPPFLSDNGFEGNMPSPILTSSTASFQAYGDTVDTSGVTDPAPQRVYQSWRITEDPYAPQDFIYSLPGMAGSDNTVRLHLTDLSDVYGYEVFDVYINSTYKGTFYGGGGPFVADVLEYSNISANGDGTITVTILPQASYYDGVYRGAISGIEVVKP